ncbi:MAG: hypothetical protein V2J42_10940 [Wenzhouxiangella sp.]|jgi:hypothetical protein|nr:hypothetical protein [Wenzhouxiangella sp.]
MKVGFSGFERWFDVDGITIRYWASNWTGREIVSIIDGDSEQVVSDKRSFRFKTPHEFNYQGRNYRLDLTMGMGKFVGFIELILYRDGERIDSDVLGSKAPQLNPETGRLDWAWAMKKVVFPLLAGGVVGAGFGYLLGSLL